MQTREKPLNFPIVGIGASAGDADSLIKFVKAVRENSGMAYIIVRHVSFWQKGPTSEGFAKKTSIPFSEITEDCDIETDHIYIVPEHRTLKVTDGSLKLAPRVANSPNMPIDVFFTSLAKEYGHLAIGIVLSGTVRDGTVGLGEIKKNGGITLSEYAKPANRDGMRTGAIAARTVDFVLPAEEMPDMLIEMCAVHGGETGKKPLTLSDQKNLKERNAALERELEHVRENIRGIKVGQEACKENLQIANQELLITNRELSERRREQSLTLDFMDALMSNLREPFLVLESDLLVRTANEAYYRKFDIGESETQGRPFFKIQQGLWENPDLRSLLEKVLRERERIVDKEIGIISASGKKISFMFNAREIVREKELDKLILLSMEDITDKKKTQGFMDTIAELKDTNAQLDRYMHIASHDLQEPLRKIMIFSNRLIVKGQSLSVGDRETIMKIAASAERMSGLVKGLLEYARLTHHGDLFERTDVNGIIKDILSDFELLIEEKRAVIKIGRLPELEGIPLQIDQLFSNLVGNALKFTKEGVRPSIEISSRPLLKEEVRDRPALSPELSYVEITVADNGIGFEQKYGEQIFIIFQRLRKNRAHAGTGIGLSLVKRIADNHNGAVSAISEEDGGATFHVTLPVEQPA